MTPDIRPFLQRAIDQQPQRWAENTYESCRDILIATLKLAGPEWQHIGKTAAMDGASVQPLGFSPFDVSLRRPDGQFQIVRIVGVSHDAAWHIQSGQQVKVIVNSAANSDPRQEIHGPARIGGAVIDPSNYRWHNPPVPQFGAERPGSGETTPQPTPVSPQFPYPDEATLVKAFQDRVKSAYKAVDRIFPDPNDSDAYRHFCRFGFSCRGMEAQAAADKHIEELREQLGAPIEP